MKDLERLLGVFESMDLEAPPTGLGRALPEVLAPLEGALLADRYRVQSLLGVGGMGKVLLAEDEQVGRLVTLKMLRGVQTEEALERLRREAIVAARLSHPNVVRVHELVEAGGQVFVVAEYVEDAQALDEAWAGLERSGRMELLLQVAAGLAAAHAAGVVHRDVKPENVLVDSTRRARVSDFGIAASRDLERLTQTGTILGSPLTMAPEQALGARVDSRADVWSLGVLLYMALYEEQPFQGENLAELLNRIAQSEPNYPRGPQVPPALRRVCARALRKDPVRRYADAGAFEAALRGALDAKPTPWPLRLGILALASALAWLWFGDLARFPIPTPTPSAAPSRSLVPTPRPEAPLRLSLEEQPLRLALGAGDLLWVETRSGVLRYDSGRLRERSEGQRLGQESAPALARAAPRTLRVQRERAEATLVGERLELRETGQVRLLPLPSGLPEAFRELALTPRSLVLVCGGESNGCRILVWDRTSGARVPLAGSDETYLAPCTVALSPSGGRLAVGGLAGLLVVFDLERPGQPPLVLKDPDLGTFTPRAHDFGRGLTAVSFPSEGELLSANGLSLALWSLPSGSIQARRSIPCRSLASRGGRVAFGGRQEVLVQRWEGVLPKRLR